MSEASTIAVIPARGGSKRIPRKNIRLFAGEPLIVHPIRTLLRSGLFEHVVVSTEDDEIAGVAQAAGAWVPFRRNSELADDHTPTAPVVLDAIERIESEAGLPVGDVCVVYPAAVFMTVDHLRNSRALLRSRNVEVVMAAAEFPAPIRRAWRECPDGTAEMVWPEHRLTRSQDLARAFFDAGQFYWWSPNARSQMISGDPVRTAMIVLSASHVQDIDTEQDWTEAEDKFKWLATQRQES